MAAGRGGLRLLRRSAALALALAALWALSLTADFSGAGDRLSRLAERPEMAVSILSSQLGRPAGKGNGLGLDGWGELLLRQSAPLAAGREAVAALRAVREEERPEPASEPEPVSEGGGDESPSYGPLPEGAVIEHTAVGNGEGKVDLDNRTSLAVDTAALAARPLELALGEGPQILIYHTHGSEAYTQTEEDRYLESDAYRTTDCEHNVVRVGEEMAQVFRELGFEVVHDTTLYDYPVYSGSYNRSREGVAAWLERYPSLCLLLDVHRDAMESQDGAAYRFITEEEGGRAAQIMFVMGSSDGGTEHPNWRSNLALAVRLQQALAEEYAHLARPITLRGSRFNQDLSPGCLLVEVGGHGNTLREAITSGRLFARTVGEALRRMEK